MSNRLRELFESFLEILDEERDDESAYERVNESPQKAYESS